MADSATTKIAPSVLASDFGQLSAECTRIIKDGADWLHMGESILFYGEDERTECLL